MSFESDLQHEMQHKTIAALCGLQMLADNLDGPERKLSFIRKRLQVIQAADILGARLLIGAGTLFMRGPDTPPDSRIKFSSRVAFMGECTQLTYMYDQDVPVDSLALVFEDPEVVSVTRSKVNEADVELQVDLHDKAVFGRSTLQVPVLAIDSSVIAA